MVPLSSSVSARPYCLSFSPRVRFPLSTFFIWIFPRFPPFVLSLAKVSRVRLEERAQELCTNRAERAQQSAKLVHLQQVDWPLPAAGPQMGFPSLAGKRV